MQRYFRGIFGEHRDVILLIRLWGTSQSDVSVRKLQFKTKKYTTSGGKEYVSDGVAGSHSPFANQLIAALDSQGSTDELLTLSGLMTYLEKLKTAPQFEKFGSDKQGSEFVFVVK